MLVDIFNIINYYINYLDVVIMMKCLKMDLKNLYKISNNLIKKCKFVYYIIEEIKVNREVI